MTSFLKIINLLIRAFTFEDVISINNPNVNYCFKNRFNTYWFCFRAIADVVRHIDDKRTPITNVPDLFSENIELQRVSLVVLCLITYYV